MNEKQKRKLKIILITVFAILIIVSFVKYFRKTPIHISNLPNKEIYFNSTGKKLVTDKSKNGIVKLKHKLEPGTYILYYDENSSERWYATMRIKNSVKEISLTFRKHSLPHIKRSLNMEDKFDDVELGSRSWSYSIYNDKNNEISYRPELNFSLRGKLANEKYSYTSKWWLRMDGSLKSKEQIIMNADDNKTIIVFEDKLHKIEVNINTNGNTATFKMNSILTE